MICSRSPFCLVAKDGPWAGILIRVQEMGFRGRVGVRGEKEVKGWVWTLGSTPSRRGLPSVSQSQQFPFTGNLKSPPERRGGGEDLEK